MQLTTTIKDILQAELIKAGKNEFVNKVGGKTQITDHNRDFAFIYKIMEYDQDVSKIVDIEFFNGLHTVNMQADYYFKKMFVNKFLDRQIAAQTVEAFASRVTALFMTRSEEITVLYNYQEDFYLGNSNQSTKTKSGYNQLNADLPQDEVNMDLNADSQDYANNNTINRAFNNSDASKSQADPDNIAKMREMWNEILDSFDLACFLQLY